MTYLSSCLLLIIPFCLTVKNLGVHVLTRDVWTVFSLSVCIHGFVTGCRNSRDSRDKEKRNCDVCPDITVLHKFITRNSHYASITNSFIHLKWVFPRKIFGLLVNIDKLRSSNVDCVLTVSIITITTMLSSRLKRHWHMLNSNCSDYGLLFGNSCLHGLYLVNPAEEKWLMTSQGHLEVKNYPVYNLDQACMEVYYNKSDYNIGFHLFVCFDDLAEQSFKARYIGGIHHAIFKSSACDI